MVALSVSQVCERSRGMKDLIIAMFGIAFSIMLFGVVITIAFSETETYKAIDEKIAKLIKGEDTNCTE